MNFAPKPPSIFTLVGLQGSGKTTTAVKLALRISDSHKPMVVACDLRRPAAVKQLKVLAEKAGVPFLVPKKPAPITYWMLLKSLDICRFSPH